MHHSRAGSGESRLREVTGEGGGGKLPLAARVLVHRVWARCGGAGSSSVPVPEGPGSGISLDMGEAGLRVVCWREQRGEERDRSESERRG